MLNYFQTFSTIFLVSGMFERRDFIQRERDNGVFERTYFLFGLAIIHS